MGRYDCEDSPARDNESRRVTAEKAYASEQVGGDPRGTIERALSQIDQNLLDLDEIIDSHINRVGPILREDAPDNPGVKSDSSIKMPDSSVAESLWAISGRIERFTRRLSAATVRIDL